MSKDVESLYAAVKALSCVIKTSKTGELGHDIFISIDLFNILEYSVFWFLQSCMFDVMQEISHIQQLMRLRTVYFSWEIISCF